MAQVVSRPLQIRPVLGDLISKVVREFAESNQLGPGGYDLWYHDEPVWFVRHDEDTPSGKLTRRVQICAFSTATGGDGLFFIPDAFLHNNNIIVKKTRPEQSKKGSQRTDLYDLRYSKVEEAEGKLASALEKAWKAAEAISL